MKTLKLLGTMFCAALVLALGAGLSGCVTNDDELVGDIPEMTLSAKTLNFTLLPDGAQTFGIEMTGVGSWDIAVDEAYADAIDVRPMSGTTSAEVQVMPNAATSPRQIKLTVSLYGDIVGRHVKIYAQDVIVNQTADGGEVSSEVLYFDNFDGVAATQTFGSGSSWPFIDQLPEFKNATGPAAANVEYSGTSISVRNNSNSNNNYSDVEGASGVNNLFFGNGASFVISGLKLAPNQSNLRLQLAAVNTVYVGDAVANDILFQKNKFHISVSADGTKWVELKDYSHSATAGARWGAIEKSFSLKAVPETFYIRFATDENNFRIDDVALYESIGGDMIDLDNASEDNPGTTTPPAGGDDSSLSGYESQSAFTVTEDNSGMAFYTLGSESTVNGLHATGFKLGTGSKAGVYTSPALGVTGDKYLTFYGFAWKGKTAKLYIKVNGGGTIDGKTETSVDLTANDGASNNAPYTITATTADYHSFRVAGLTASSTISISTSDSYSAASNDSSGRAILARVRLTDTDDNGDAGSGGGQPAEPTPGDAVTMTIPEIIAACTAAGSDQKVLNDSKDVVFEAVVVTDKAGGNWSSNNLVVMTPGATTSKNGILLYGSGITNPGDASYNFEPGDKVKVTLKAGQARVTVYSSCNEVTGSAGAAWVTVEKTGEKVAVTPIVLTGVSNLVDYQSMPVTVKNVTSPASGTWNATQTFKVGTADLTVYTATGATFYNKAFKTNVTADMTGMVTLYKGAVQLAPRNEADITAFMDGGSGDSGSGSEQPSNPPTVTSNSVTFSELGYDNAADVTTVELSDVKITFDSGSNSNGPKYYNTGTSVRIYGSNTMTFDAGSKKITKIVLTFGSGDGTNELTATPGTFATDTWTGSSSKVVFTVGGTSGHRRIQAVAVTVE